MKLRGWKRISTCVWDHTSGVRIHTGGIIRNGSIEVYAGNWLYVMRWDYWTRIVGGSRRRGLMAMALKDSEYVRPD